MWTCSFPSTGWTHTPSPGGTTISAGEFTTTKALGWIDAERMKKDYELVQTYLGMEKPFPVDSAFTTRLLDTSIKMDASKVKK